MRLLTALLICVALLCCQDRKSGVITNDLKKSITKSVKKKEPSVKKEKDFLITDANVMEFLLDFGEKNKETLVRITTDFGTIEIKLFKNTKFHRSNFIYLTKKKYFDNTQFYRVISNFVIQGGNSDDRITLKKRQNIGRYLLPNDYNKGYKHERGMVSMPSKNIDNPYKKASPFEFFIVQKQGGAHHLNGDYTIFGTVVKGMNTVDTIAAVPTDKSDWPLQNVVIKKIEVIK